MLSHSLWACLALLVLAPNTLAVPELEEYHRQHFRIGLAGLQQVEGGLSGVTATAPPPSSKGKRAKGFGDSTQAAGVLKRQANDEEIASREFSFNSCFSSNLLFLQFFSRGGRGFSETKGTSG